MSILKIKILITSQPGQSNQGLSSPNLFFGMLLELLHMNYNTHHRTAEENEKSEKQSLKEKIKRFIWSGMQKIREILDLSNANMHQ